MPPLIPINFRFNTVPWRRVLNWVGLGLGFAGIIFIILKFRDYDWKIDFTSVPASTWFTFFLMALVYFGACFLLGFAWHNILLFLELRVRRVWSIRTYGISQLAKYVPGNIFQFASRQAIGVADGLPGAPLAKSIFWELLLLASCGLLFGVLVLPGLWKPFPQLISIVIFLAVGFGYFLLMYFKVNHRIGISIGLYLAFLVISGFVFLFIANQVAGYSWLDTGLAVLVIGAYVFAWLVGLITPGAPAGAGVREVLLFLLLKGVLSEQDLLMVIVLTRMATILGDFLFFLFAMMVDKNNLMDPIQGGST
jgi:glycosyltransferase 2 family protein